MSYFCAECCGMFNDNLATNDCPKYGCIGTIVEVPEEYFQAILQLELNGYIVVGCGFADFDSASNETFVDFKRKRSPLSIPDGYEIETFNANFQYIKPYISLHREFDGSEFELHDDIQKDADMFLKWASNLPKCKRGRK